MGRALPVKAALLLAALWASGCAWRGPQPLEAWKAVGSSDDIVALDQAAHRLVAVQTKSQDRTADGRLRLRLELANLSDTDLPVQVQTRFRDAAGAVIGDDTPAEMVVLPAQGSKGYQAISLRADAAAYTVSVNTVQKR